jgi:gas vesicle protein
MNPKYKKFISLFLIFSLLALSVNLYAKERRGATLIIQGKDSQQIKGELITVKPNSLLLLDTEGKDVSVDINDIKFVTIVKKSKFWKGAGTGALIGGGAALFLYLVSTPRSSGSSRFFGEGFRTFVTLVAVILGGGVGGLIGGIIGAATTDETIQIEGKADLEIKEILEKLRKKARIRDYK